MLNQVVIVGRLVDNPTTKELEDGKKISEIVVAVPRSWKNEEGIYESDFIPCTLWDGIAQNTTDYCHKGDIIGVKGRIESNNNGIRIVAEKVTFLSSKKEKEEN